MSALKDCRDYGLLTTLLSNQELEVVKDLLIKHEGGECGCDPEDVDLANHCIIARWLEGCTDTMDFVEEIRDGQ